MRDYYPLKRGQKRRYRSRAPGEPVVEYTVETVSVIGVPRGASEATMRTTVAGAPPPRVSESSVEKTDAAVYEDTTKVLTLPPRIGDAWDVDERAYKIVSLDESVATPAGTFPECVKVQYLIAGGDAGSGARYYAPDVGFIKEECADEADPFVSELIP